MGMEGVGEMQSGFAEGRLCQMRGQLLGLTQGVQCLSPAWCDGTACPRALVGLLWESTSGALCFQAPTQGSQMN